MKNKIHQRVRVITAEFTAYDFRQFVKVSVREPSAVDDVIKPRHSYLERVFTFP